MNRRANLVGPRRIVMLTMLLLGILAAWQMELSAADLIPSSSGWEKTKSFFAAAFHPALQYQSTPPSGTTPLLLKVAAAIWQTIMFAVAATGVALITGCVLGFFASAVWCEGDPAGGSRWWARSGRRVFATSIVWSTRALIVFMRSIHELLWAVLFLSALGLNSFTAILAIVIPYTGVFAKVFSEIIDETPRDAAYAARSLGATPAKMFFVGILPRALPDMMSYACYRLECGMRSSAVLGYFGIPTLGFYLRPAFEEQHFGEVWTYLYALIALVFVVDRWSNWSRRRLMR